MNVWWGPGFPGLFVFAFFVLFWVGVVWLIVALVRRDRPAPPGRTRPAALDVLEERYARGEITPEEFIERRTVLLGGTPTPTPTPTPAPAPAPTPAPAPPPPQPAPEPPSPGGQPG